MHWRCCWRLTGKHVVIACTFVFVTIILVWFFVRVRVRVHVCTCACVLVFLCASAYACVLTHLPACALACLYACAYPCAYACARACACTLACNKIKKWEVDLVVLLPDISDRWTLQTATSVARFFLGYVFVQVTFTSDYACFTKSPFPFGFYLVRKRFLT